MCQETLKPFDSKIILEKGSSEVAAIDFENLADYDDEEDDDFEVDRDKYVGFEKKLKFSEQLKHCSKECLTNVTKLILG